MFKVVSIHILDVFLFICNRLQRAVCWNELIFFKRDFVKHPKIGNPYSNKGLIKHLYKVIKYGFLAPLILLYRNFIIPNFFLARDSIVSTCLSNFNLLSKFIPRYLISSTFIIIFWSS